VFGALHYIGYSNEQFTKGVNKALELLLQDKDMMVRYYAALALKELAKSERRM